MNNRIKELKQQATDYVDGVDAGLKLDHYQQFVDLKFAELIIEECLEICKERERANLYGVREVENTIKQHFGVEL